MRDEMIFDIGTQTRRRDSNLIVGCCGATSPSSCRRRRRGNLKVVCPLWYSIFSRVEWLQTEPRTTN